MQALDLTPEQHEIIEFLIANLDDKGYLNVKSSPLPELAKAYGKPVTVEELEEVLHMLQKLDPAGIGARDLKECLLLQLTPETPHVELLRTIILGDHLLEDVACNRLPVIQKRTGADISTIKEAIEVLRRFDPKPGSRFSSVAHAIRRARHHCRAQRGWRIHGSAHRRLDAEYPCESQVSRTLPQQVGGPEEKEYLRRKIQAAQWLIESIEQRRATLEKVTKAIISHQKAFLNREHDYIEPLKMQQIADQVKVHVTTVSRAVDDKWVETPRGVFPLKRFFGGGTKNNVTGEDVAWEKIKQTLLDLIGQEDKSNPLSDEDLVEKLQNRAIRCSADGDEVSQDAQDSLVAERKDWAMQ